MREAGFGQHSFGCLAGIDLFKDIQAEERGEIVLNIQHDRNLKGSSGGRATANNPNEHDALS